MSAGVASQVQARQPSSRNSVANQDASETDGLGA